MKMKNKNTTPIFKIEDDVIFRNKKYKVVDIKKSYFWTTNIYFFKYTITRKSFFKKIEIIVDENEIKKQNE